MTFLIILGVVITITISFTMYAMCYVSGQANRPENDLDQELYLQKLKENKNGK